MSTMRWADSDSSDDEEAYVPPTSSAEVPPQKQGNRVEHNKDAVQSPASHPPKATLQSLAAGGRGHPNSNQSRSNRNSPHHHHHQNQHLHQNQNQHSHSHSHPHGGRGRGGRSSGGRSGRGSDWRQMAKEQSQLNSKGVYGTIRYIIRYLCTTHVTLDTYPYIFTNLTIPHDVCLSCFFVTYQIRIVVKQNQLTVVHGWHSDVQRCKKSKTRTRGGSKNKSRPKWKINVRNARSSWEH